MTAVSPDSSASSTELPPAQRRISRRIAGIAESATLAVDAKAKALQAAGKPVIGFGAGEPDFPTPDYIVEAAVAACRQPAMHRYTPAGGLPALKEAIVAKTARDSGLQATPANVLVTNGGKQAVYEAFATMLAPGWMLGVIEGNASGVEGWDIADTFPGGGGNWGGSFLTVPSTGENV